jgi:hypothetical protein
MNVDQVPSANVRWAPSLSLESRTWTVSWEGAGDGPGSVKVGRPLGREGGLREFDILGGRGFISFLAVPRHQCVYVCNVTWYG